jgi:DNA modification methylase
MNISFREDYRNRGWHNFEENLTQPRHRWYPFKEGFSNQLVSEALNQAARGKRHRLKVIDPFAGSGTTPLTAAILGHDAIAIEVNPFCAFTSTVKCRRNFRTNYLIEAAKRFTRLGGQKARSPLEGISTFTESEGNEKWLFNLSVIRAFTAVWNTISVDCEADSAALKLAAIRAVMKCCNAKKDGKCLRYYEDWKERDYDEADFQRSFLNCVGQMQRDIDLAPIRGDHRIKIQKGDSRCQLANLESRSCDLMVTSPPYLNSFDYSDVYRPELFLGGFVSSNEALRNIRLKTVRSHLQVDWEGETNIENPMIETVVKALRRKRTLWNNRIPSMVEAYFHDMDGILQEAARILKPAAEAWIVVSTSAYKGVQIPVDLILADLASKHSFQLKGIYVLRSLRVAGQQQSCFEHDGLPLRESLLILKR